MSVVYQVDPHRISYREDGYCEFWEREPDLVLHQTDDAEPHIDTYRFPMKEDAKLGDRIVYLTGGMSDMIQPGTEDHHEIFQRMEFFTYARRIVMNASGSTDFIGWVVGWMAHYPFEQKTCFQQGETFDWGSPIIPGSDMHGFYFAHLPLEDKEHLCELSGTAKTILHLVTLSRKELDYRMEHGIEKLLDLLEEHSLPPFFDLDRRCLFST